MIEYQQVESQSHIGDPTPLHTMKEQVTLVKGWTQLVNRYAMEERPGHDENIRKGLTRIDAATTHLTQLLAQALL